MDNGGVYRRRQVFNCAYILPNQGVPLDAFVAFIQPNCQQTVYRLIKEGALQVANGLVSPNPLICLNWERPQFQTLLYFLSGVIATLKDWSPKPTSHAEMLLLIREYYKWEASNFSLNAYFAAVAKFLRAIGGRTELTTSERKIAAELYDSLPMKFYIYYWSSKNEDPVVEFHSNEGKYLIDLLIKTIGQVYVPDSALEYIYDVMADYLMQIDPASSLKWYLQLLDLLYDSDADKAKLDLAQFKIGRCESMLANRTGGSK